MSDSLTKYLRLADPLHRGLTLLGVAYGLSLNRGLSSGLAGGGFVLYRGTSAGDATEPVGAAGRRATTIRPWAWLGQTAGQRYVYRLAAVGAGGVESASSPAAMAAVRMDGLGQAGLPAPAAPQRLSATATAGGRFRLGWDYLPGRVLAAEFHVYGDAGTGVMDWATRIATVRATGGRDGAGMYGATTGAFTHGTTQQFGVRAAAASGVEDVNLAAVSAAAVVDGPAAAQVSAVGYGADV